MDARLAHKSDALRARLRTLESAVVAFSGGVDSAVLLRAATDVLGHAAVLAVTARSPSLPRAESETVAAVARECGAEHLFIDTHELDNPEYAANPPERCYFCKVELYARLSQLARERGLKAILCGTNTDDLEDFRPGSRAAGEFAVCAPLAEVGLTKAEVRSLARELGLSVHDKPAAPCLSSRIPYGQPVTVEKLRQIDAAEAALHGLGFRECRVRHHGTLARIEVPADELARFAEAAVRASVDAKLRALGFQYVALDLRGFRSGSLNEALPQAPARRSARD